MITYTQELHVAKHNFLILDRRISRRLFIRKKTILRGLQTRPAEQSNESLRDLPPEIQHTMQCLSLQVQIVILTIAIMKYRTIIWIRKITRIS